MEILDQFFKEAGETVDATLEMLVPHSRDHAGRLAEAIRWSLFAGGKRFRPALVFASGKALGAPPDRLARTAAAIEMLHTYSLIHDDLPSMDDDDLRRGRETCHVKFDEATAILAGDALQALSFQVIAEDTSLDLATRVALLSGLGRAASCMVAGQHMDLESEGRDAELSDLEAIHRNKTGALIAFSIDAGAMIAGAGREDAASIRAYGEKIGLLFQVVDDILDITQPSEILGKTAGKDLKAAKLTYPSFLGLDQARELSRRISGEAVSLLPRSVQNDPVLKAIPEYLMRRQK